ncbi:bone morphogenetic protein 10 [Procambarus clarkii]|uniref:bone morphogenetic protein 10 n=1 Tax=Procambarus clarkii TaxID=6728 RepID=UPI003744A1E1
MVAGRAVKAAATGGWPGRATVSLTIFMNQYSCGAAHLATFLLLVTVGVAGAVAKPAPPLGAINSTPSHHSPEDEDYYYYDYDYGSNDNLNMSEFHLPEEAGEDAPHVPRYMLELYADQSSLHANPHPGADLVRSFIAVTTESSHKGGEARVEGGGDAARGSAGDAARGSGVRVHTLLFNVTVPRRERVTSASLRLYALITRDQYAYIGVERRVRLVIETERGITLDDITPQGLVVSDTESGGGGLGTSRGGVQVTVCERDIYELQNAWETFDVTSAVKYWMAHPSVPQLLQIHIESVFSTVGEGGDMDVATAPRTDSEPLLLLYSSTRHRHQARKELDLMISHEYEDHPEHKRRRRRRSIEDPERLRSRRNVAELQEEESNVIWEGELDVPGLPTQAQNPFGGRAKGRRPRKRKAKNGCKKKPLRVDFKDIGWDTWIIAPPSYEANQCSGKCNYPLASHLSPTKHAVVQNLVHSLHPDRTSRACCVPTLLGPISLLYLENGITTFKYDYDDMVVLECGCR